MAEGLAEDQPVEVFLRLGVGQHGGSPPHALHAAAQERGKAMTFTSCPPGGSKD